MKTSNEAAPAGGPDRARVDGARHCILPPFDLGIEVIAYNRTAARARKSVAHIQTAMDELIHRRIVPPAAGRNWRDRFRLTPSFEDLGPARFVIESVKEDLELKRQIYDVVEGLSLRIR